MLIARPPSCALTVRRSQLYSSATETKFVDESLRLSSFRAIKSEPLFQLCDTLLDEVNKQAGEDFHFTLVRSDATQIKYSAGGANTPSAQPGSAAAGPCFGPGWARPVKPGRLLSGGRGPPRRRRRPAISYCKGGQSR